jgi:2-polyprenyl-3-methyl-5-hydroxy-6-metoxy-1,4-benzoquinol methylase
LLGYGVQGIEISSDATAEAQKAYNIPDFNGTVAQYHAAGHRADFDIALACTVLEHVEAPDSFVDACHSLLRAGGILAMDMPNMDALNARASGAAWEMYQKYHIYLFSPSTITKLLETASF